MDFFKIILSLIPISSIMASMIIWFSQRKIEQKLLDAERKEQDKEQMQLILIKTINASMAVSEALAIVYLQEVDKETTKELQEALNFLHKVKAEQKEFFQKQTVQHLS